MVVVRSFLPSFDEVVIGYRKSLNFSVELFDSSHVLVTLKYFGSCVGEISLIRDWSVDNQKSSHFGSIKFPVADTDEGQLSLIDFQP